MKSPVCWAGFVFLFCNQQGVMKSLQLKSAKSFKHIAEATSCVGGVKTEGWGDNLGNMEKFREK